MYTRKQYIDYKLKFSNKQSSTLGFVEADALRVELGELNGMISAAQRSYETEYGVGYQPQAAAAAGGVTSPTAGGRGPGSAGSSGTPTSGKPRDAPPTSANRSNLLSATH